MHLFAVDILDKEWCDRCKETVSLWLFVDATYDRQSVKLVLREEFIAKIFRKLIFQHVADKDFTQNSTRTFIAENVTEGRDVVADFLSVIVAGV